MTEEHVPNKENAPRFCDDRGTFTNVPVSFQAKRVYIIENSQKGVIRAFHGHKNEDKIMYVVRGSFIFNFISMEDMEKSISFSLDEKTPAYLFCPRNWYNGFVSLKDDSALMVISSCSMEESKNDDYRLDPMVKGEGIWKVKNR